MTSPAEILTDPQAALDVLPVCDHYCGTAARIAKSLQLQAQMREEFGANVFDCTLDCEDGAPVGGETEHAHFIAEAALSAPEGTRLGVRVHPTDHPAFVDDLRIILSRAAARLSYVMLPKTESVADVICAEKIVTAIYPAGLPLHVLIESPAAVRRAFEIAAHPGVQSLSFGLMDFVSAHGGAIPAAGMTLGGQFSHPLIVRAKTEIASAAHAFGKTPSHCVVTEFKDADAIAHAARRAARDFGFTRMWSIHPAQIRPIIEAFAPEESEIAAATEILTAAEKADWAPIDVRGQLHDRASYRYFWQILRRAHATGRKLQPEVLNRFHFS